MNRIQNNLKKDDELKKQMMRREQSKTTGANSSILRDVKHTVGQLCEVMSISQSTACINLLEPTTVADKISERSALEEREVERSTLGPVTPKSRRSKRIRSKGRNENRDTQRPHSMYFREYRPRRTETEYYTTEYETEYYTEHEMTETAIDTVIEIEEDTVETPVVLRRKQESDLLTAVKTLIIVFLFAIMLYIAGCELGYFQEDEIGDDTMKSEKAQSDGGEAQIIDESKPPERGELRKFALLEKKAIHEKLLEMENALDRNEMGDEMKSKLMGVIGQGLEKFGGQHAKTLKKYAPLLGEKAGSLVDEMEEAKAAKRADKLTDIIDFKNALAIEILDTYFVPNDNQEGKMVGGWAFRRMGKDKSDPTDLVFEGELKEPLTKEEIIQIVAEAWKEEKSSTSSMLQHPETQQGNWKSIQANCAAAELELKWDSEGTMVRAASDNRGTDSELTQGFVPGVKVNVLPASFRENEKSAAFFYLPSHGGFPYVQELIRKLNLGVNNPERFLKLFNTSLATYDQLHLFLDEHKMPEGHSAEYTFRIHARGSVTTNAAGELTEEDCATGSDCHCNWFKKHFHCQDCCKPQMGDETIRMRLRQDQVEKNLKTMFFQRAMIFEAVKKMTEMNNPKYQIEFEWDGGHNGQRWTYKDEVDAKGKRPVFHLNGTVTLKIKDFDGFDRCCAPCKAKPLCCVPVCSDAPCCKDNKFWKAIDRNAGWGTCCCCEHPCDSDQKKICCTTGCDNSCTRCAVGWTKVCC